MTNEILIPAWIDTIGMVGSILGFSIAVYLQIIIKRKVPAKYVIAFVAIGFSLFLLSIRLTSLNYNQTILLRAFGNITLIILELIAVRGVIKELHAEE